MVQLVVALLVVNGSADGCSSGGKWSSRDLSVRPDLEPGLSFGPRPAAI